MSKGNGMPAEFLSFVSRMLEFKPCLVSLSGLNQMMILEQNCSYTEEREGDSNLGVLRKNHGDDAGKIVGFVIYNFNEWLLS